MCDCDRLRRENAELRGQLEEYEAAVPRDLDIPPHQVRFKLTPSQARLVSALVSASPNIVSKEKLHHAMSAFAETEPQIVSVVICNTRKKLPPDTIVNVNGVGFYIPADKVEALR